MTSSADAIAASRTPLTQEMAGSLIGPRGPFARVDVVAASSSTNSDLLAALPDDPQAWPHLSVLAADHQTAGRGRSGRGWETPAGAALTASVVLRPTGIGPAAMGWAPLVVGLAVVRALRSIGVQAWLKWPNDVVVEVGETDVDGWGRWRKCVGILCETLPGAGAIIAGVGVNVSQGADELPVPHAASLATLGADTLDRLALLRAIGRELDEAVDTWTGAADGEPIASDVAKVCASIGWEVVVDVPSGPPVAGTVRGLSPEGGMLVETPSGQTRTVMAGDVRVRRA